MSDTSPSNTGLLDHLQRWFAELSVLPCEELDPASFEGYWSERLEAASSLSTNESDQVVLSEHLEGLRAEAGRRGFSFGA